MASPLSTLRDRSPDWLSRDALLGAFSVNELVIRGIASESSLVRNLLRTLAESTVVPTAVALAPMAAPGLGLLSELAALCLFGYAIYTYLPGILPDDVAAVVDGRAFRVLSAALVLASSRSVSILIGTVSAGGSGMVLLPAFVFGLSGVTVGLAFAFRRRAPDDYAVTLEWALSRFRTSGDAEDGSFGDREAMVTLGVLYGAVVIFLGTAVYVAGLLYPIPEVLMILVAAASVLTTTTDDVPEPIDGSADAVDVEASAFDLVTRVVRSTPGTALVGLSLLGLGVPSLIVSVGLGQVVRLIGSGIAGLASGSGTALRSLGIGVSLAAVSLYNAGYWLQTFRRIPRFVEHWDEVHVSGYEATGTDPADLPTRPPGYLLPAAVAFGAAGFAMPPADGVFVDAYGFLWPIPLVAMAWTAWRAFRADPNPIETEGRAVVGSAAIILAGFLVWGLGANGVAWNALVGLPFVAGTLAFFYYQAGLRARRSGGDGIERYYNSLSWFVAAVVTVLVSQLLDGGMETLFLLIGAIYLASGVYFGATTWYEASETHD